MSDAEIRRLERAAKDDPSDDVAAERAEAARRRAGRATIEDVLPYVERAIRANEVAFAATAESWPKHFGLYCHVALTVAARLGLDPELRRKLLSRIKPEHARQGGWLSQAWLKAANDAAGPLHPKPLPDAGPLFARKDQP